MALRLNDIEVAFRLRAEAGLKALDAIVERSERAEKKFANFTKTAESFGTKLALSGAAITAAFGLAAAAGQKEIVALQGLKATVDGTGESFDSNRQRIDDFVAGLARATNATDGDIVPALNRAVFATGSLAKGMEVTNIAVRLASAGIGGFEQNATLVTQVMEGNVEVLGRLLPQFKGLSDRLAAGESRASLTAEALEKLNSIAANIPPPTGYSLLTKATADLQEASGQALTSGLEPLFARIEKGTQQLIEFSNSGMGKVVISTTAVVGVLSTLAGGVLLLTSQFISSGLVVKAWAVEVSLATKAAQLLGFVLSPAGVVLAGLAALAIFTGKAAIELNKLSAESDKARDRAFSASRVAQFNAELAALRGTLSQLRAGTISAADAQQVFNRFGLEGAEQAEARVNSLTLTVDRLKKEKTATEELTLANAARTKELQKEAELRAKLDAAAAERLETSRIELAQEKELEDFRAKNASVLEPTDPNAELAGVGKLDDLLPKKETKLELGLDDLLEPADLFIEKMGTIEERVQALADQEQGLGQIEKTFLGISDSVDQSLEPINSFANVLAGRLPQILEQTAQLGLDFAVGLVNGSQSAAAATGKFLKQLAIDLVTATAKAFILKNVLGSLAGGGILGGIGGAIGKLFQDPVADRLARFEGTRFVDLFFQGLAAQFSQSRDRLDAALVDTRDISSSGGGSSGMSVIVYEATPETRVEFADRIEPRLRRRSSSRTGPDPNGRFDSRSEIRAILQKHGADVGAALEEIEALKAGG